MSKIYKLKFGKTSKLGVVSRGVEICLSVTGFGAHSICIESAAVK